MKFKAKILQGSVRTSFIGGIMVAISFMLLITNCKDKGQKNSSSLVEKEFTKSVTHNAKSLQALATQVPEFSATEWLKEHWKFPLEKQPAPPAAWTQTEKSLQPEDCGSCHVQQFEDWKHSRHAKAMGPGVLGQLLDMQKDAPHLSQTCQKCHAPLAEQHPFSKSKKANPNFSAPLQHKGLVCASCHVRDGKVYGPVNPINVPEGKAHGGGVPKEEFSKSEFCINCHDFPSTGQRLKGKLMQETGQEWRRTDFAKQGITCQACHMPGRRHLWKGIHDSAMVRDAVEIEFSQQSESVAGLWYLKVTNRRVGHRMPTYIIPRIVLIIEQLDKQGAPILGTKVMGMIGRGTTPSHREEVFDTRLMPNESYAVPYEKMKHLNAQSLRARVEVWPDEGYRLFFNKMVHEPGKLPPGEGGRMIEQALNNAEQSRYVLWSETQKYN